MKHENTDLTIADIILKDVGGTNPAEKELIARWIKESPVNRAFYERLQTEPGLVKDHEFMKSLDKKVSWAEFEQMMALEPKKSAIKISNLLKLAAAVFLIMGTAIILLHYHKPQVQEIVEHGNRYKNDLNPGSNVAVLTLGNGQQIQLTKQTGVIANEAGAIIKRNTNGQLVYENSNSLKSTDQTSKSNILTTPAGGTYEVILPDGSRVWLNSASSLSYPIAFSRGQRKVILTGEGYFEISHDAKRPFIVSCLNKQDVQVLGTHFNVNSYDAIIKTTLLQGSVKVTAMGNQTKYLLPGQQAKLDNTHIVVTAADTAEAVAWHHGLFRFNRADTKDVMRQLERWYGVEVRYDSTYVPGKQLTGVINRNMYASKVLNVLSKLDIYFRIEGKTIYVTSTPYIAPNSTP